MEVNHTIQDDKGYMWLATDQGLFRYDGKNFEDYNRSLRSKTIRNFCKWDEDTLLFTNDTGIHKLEYGENGTAISSFVDIPSPQYPTTLFKDSKSRLWSGRMDGTIVLYINEDNGQEVFSSESIKRTEQIFFGEDAFGTIWALIPKTGVFYFDEGLGQFKKLNGYENANHFLVDGATIWFVGDDIQKVTITKNKILENKVTFPTNKELVTISKSSSGTLYLATDTELFTFNKEAKNSALKKVFGSNDPHRVEELPFQGINHVGFTLDEMDQNDVIWVSSNEGLCLLWTSFFQNVSGIGYDNVMGLHATKNGQILVSQGPVHRIFNNGGQISFVKEDYLNGVTSMLASKTDTWYASTEGIVYHYKNGKLANTHNLSERGSGIFFMSMDHKGDIWFCQATSDKPLLGVAKIDNNGSIKEYASDKGFSSRILVIREGGRNELYAAGIGTTSYLYKYNREKDVFVNKSLPLTFKVSSNFEVHDMAVDNRGIVWMATTDGLLKYDTETVRKVHLGELTHNEVRAVAAMPNNQLWIATDTNGLIHIDTEGNYVVFDEKSGTPSKVASYRCLALDSNSQLWVGTAEGIVYSSETLPAPIQTKIPEVRAITLENEELRYDDQVEIGEQDELRIEMTTLSYPSNEVSYQYKIFEKDMPEDEVKDLLWVDAEGNSILPKNHVPGTYEIWIRAQKSGGYAWSNPQKINLNVKGKWFATWWGISLLAILGFLFFWYFLRHWFLKRISGLEDSLNQKQSELSAKEAELVSQSASLKNKQLELKSTGAHMYLLQRLIRQMPKKGVWKEFWPSLKKLVELPTGIDAFEIAYKKGEDVYFFGYERGVAEATKRHEEFSEKEDLASYVLVINKPLSISNFSEEAGEYISGKDDRGYPARLLVPFQQVKESPAVLCVYNKKKDTFSQLDLTLIQILASYLSAAITDELR